MRVDCLKLAAETFDACRHGLATAEALLPALLVAMDAADADEMLRPEVRDEKLVALDAETRREIAASSDAAPPYRSRYPLWKFCRTGALELLCLRREGRTAALRSLGYALHPAPAALRDGEKLAPERYELCFAVAAFAWDEYSEPLQAELARRMGLSLQEAAALARKEGFAVDMFGANETEGRKPAKPWWRFW